VKLGPALVCILAAGMAYAQAQNLTFSYQGSTDTVPNPIAAGGQILFPNTAVGSSSTENLIITNQGAAAVTLSGIAASNGSFLVPSGSILVPGGGRTTITIAFIPQAGGPVSAVLSLLADQTPYTFNLAGSVSGGSSFVTSYILNPGGNQTQIGSGGTLVFGSTLVNTTATASFIIANPATAPAGTVSGVTVSSGAFSISGLPLLPLTIAPGGQIQFTITFAPTTLGAQSGTLSIGGLGTIKLSGTSSGPLFTYQIINGTSTTPVLPNGTVSLPDTPVGQTSALTFAVTNSGDAAGQITAVTTIGNSALVVADLIPLPTTLAPGGIITFQVQFIPNAVGSMSGRLLINGTLFTFNGVGLGSVLSVSVSVASATTNVPNLGTAFYPNTIVGSNQQGVVTVTNTGNVAATVSTISVAGSSFTLAGTPPLPANLSPGNALSFPVVFAPNAIGTLTGTLAINGLIITLQGTGTTPPTLPSYSFTGASGTATPLQQPSVGLQLANTYPIDLSGTLTITFASAAFVDDQEIQFSSGGRTVNFTIPANTTIALFGQSQQIQFQSGTIAGNITLTPAFTIGTVNLTPSSPTVKTFQVAAAAPQIRTVQISNTTATSFQILITGYSTTRSVTSLTLSFTPASGSDLQTTSLSINSDSAFSSWYQTGASATVGSQFTATVTINVNGAINAVQSVGVVAANAQGNSSLVSASL